jgi:hypothetical protein
MRSNCEALRAALRASVSWGLLSSGSKSLVKSIIPLACSQISRRLAADSAGKVELSSARLWSSEAARIRGTSSFQSISSLYSLVLSVIPLARPL